MHLVVLVCLIVPVSFVAICAGALWLVSYLEYRKIKQELKKRNG